jgi:biotin carboxyl carrier protein
MKLTAEIEGGRRVIELRREGARVFAEVEGRRYELEARETEPGVLLLVFADGRAHECRAEPAGARGEAWRVAVGARAFDVTLADPRRLPAGAGAGGAGEGRAAVTAQMPGKVVRVLVEQGQQVEAGDGLVVVEAMKMQNELKSPKAGTVVELRAAPGATVNAGEVLAVVE